MEQRPRTIRPPAFGPWAAATALVLITFVTYLPALRSGFIWDDDTFLTANPLIKAPDGLYRFWFTRQAPDYFPLTSSMLWVEWRLWGTHATGYHAVNVLLHALSAVLIWRALKRLAVPGAWLAGLVFAIHPVNVESVAWITERKNTLPMVLYLVSILAFLRHESLSTDRKWYALSLASFLLALLAKTSIVMLPAALLLLAWWQRGSISKRDLLRTLPFFALAGIMGAVTIWFQYSSAIREDVVRTDDLLSRTLVAGRAVWFYLGKALWPADLCFAYPRWTLPATGWTAWVPLLALAGGLLALCRRPWGRPVLFAMGYFILSLLPALGFFNIYFMRYSLVADHWQYVAIVGVIALMTGLAAWGARQLPPAGQRAAWAAMGLAVLALAAAAWQAQAKYRDEGALWTDTLERDPNSFLAQTAMGKWLAGEGRLPDSVEPASLPAGLREAYGEGYKVRAQAAMKRSDFRAALADYERAALLRPNDPIVFHNRGSAHWALRNAPAALRDYHRAIALDPLDSGAFLMRAQVFAALGDYDRAWADVRAARQLGRAIPPPFLESLSAASGRRE